MPDGSASSHLYRPKLATVLAEGYNLGCFRRDMLAALTVGIVALPLSMAIAVASGVSPERGLYAAVIGGFLVSALGGSRRSAVPPARSSFWWRPPLPNSASMGFCSRFSCPASC
jgi:SulP family sulfate permease